MTARPVYFYHLTAKRPGAIVRCAPPATPAPFVSKTLVLKHVDPQRLGELGQAALTLFSTFWQDWERTAEETAQEAADELKAFMGPRTWEVRAATSADRRFSGDGHLSRGRYYSVCHAPNGWDGGTMVRELTAYHDPLRTGIVDIHDVQDELARSADTHRSSVDAPPDYRLEIPGFLRDEHPWLRPFDYGHDTARVVLQAAVVEEDFKRLVDLRIPAVAAWFTHNLTRLRWLSDDNEETAAFPCKPPLDRFVDLLPSLLTQRPGGGEAASLIAGQWLRCLGADGLVFPSARSDASLVVIGGRLERFHGWNLVDFRDAPAIRTISADLTAGWVQHIVPEVDQPPVALYSGVRIVTETRSGGDGSWSVHGIALSNAAFRTFRSALALYRWGIGDYLAPATESALTRGLGGRASAEGLMDHSGAFIRALFGDAELRRSLMRVFADLTPEDRSHVDLSAAFEGVDRRMTARSHR